MRRENVAGASSRSRNWTCVVITSCAPGEDPGEERLEQVVEVARDRGGKVEVRIDRGAPRAPGSA